MRTTLGEICVQDRKIVSPGSRDAANLPYLGLEQVESQTGRILNQAPPLEAETGVGAAFRFDSRHVLYSKLRPYLNKVALPEHEGRCSTEMIPLLAEAGVDRDFLAFLLRSPAAVAHASSANTGARMPRADMAHLFSWSLSLPDLPTQRRLASRLKAQMASVEQARQVAQTQHAAGALLPARLLMEVFLSPAADAWPRQAVGEALDFLTARSINLKGKAAVRAVTTACLLETGFTEAGVKDALMMEGDVADAFIQPGEILVARSNTPALVGRSALFEGSTQPLVASDLTIRLRCRDGLEPGFAAACFSNLFVAGYWRERASGASDTMKKIGRAQLAATEIPIPPLATQRHIATRLREQFATIHQLQASLATQLEALDKLPGAYLREAFGSLEAASK